jgi:hypothetical protein
VRRLSAAIRCRAPIGKSSAARPGNGTTETQSPTAVTPKIDSVTGLRVVPLTLSEANAAVAEWHRHHAPVRWHTFSLGVMRGDDLVGAAIVFRPATRHYNSKEVAEVARLVTDGTPHLPRAHSPSNFSSYLEASSETQSDE